MFFGGDWWGSGHGSLNNMRNGRNSRNSSSFNCLTWSWTLPSWMVMPRGGLRLFSDLELEVYSGSNVSPHFLGKGYPPRAWHFGPLKPLQNSAAWCVVCSKEHWSDRTFVDPTLLRFVDASGSFKAVKVCSKLHSPWPNASDWRCRGDRSVFAARGCQISAMDVKSLSLSVFWRGAMMRYGCLFSL